MSKSKKQGVHIFVSEKFFDNYFEKERRAVCKKKKEYMSQIRFTEYLANSGVKFVYPKKPKINIKKFKLKRPKI